MTPKDNHIKYEEIKSRAIDAKIFNLPCKIPNIHDLIFLKEKIFENSEDVNEKDLKDLDALKSLI